jgi:hypothetical protein
MPLLLTTSTSAAWFNGRTVHAYSINSHSSITRDTCAIAGVIVTPIWKPTQPEEANAFALHYAGLDQLQDRVWRPIVIGPAVGALGAVRPWDVFTSSAGPGTEQRRPPTGKNRAVYCGFESSCQPTRTRRFS